MLFGEWRPAHRMRTNRERRAEKGNIPRTITIASANITSWRRHANDLMRVGGDIMAVQEARLTRYSAMKAEAHAGGQGYSMVGGKPLQPMPVRRKGGQGQPTDCTCGVVLVLARRSTCPGTKAAGAMGNVAREIYEKSRHARAAIPLQARGRTTFLHIESLYNKAGSSAAVQVRRGRSMARALEDCSAIGEQPVLICCDSNMSRSEVMKEAILSGKWVDLGARFATEGGPEPTFGSSKEWDRVSRGVGVTRPDRTLANSTAAGLAIGFELIRDAMMPGHLPIRFVLEARRADDM